MYNALALNVKKQNQKENSNEDFNVNTKTFLAVQFNSPEFFLTVETNKRKLKQLLNFVLHLFSHKKYNYSKATF